MQRTKVGISRLSLTLYYGNGDRKSKKAEGHENRQIGWNGVLRYIICIELCYYHFSKPQHQEPLVMRP